MPVKIKMNLGWQDQIKGKMDVALLEMTTDVHRRAIVLAPKLTRALVNSGIIEKIPKGYRVRFGNARVPYARRRHFENKKNPSTIGYLALAGDSVARGDKSKYFRGKI